MNSFVIDTNSISPDEDLQLDGYDSYLMVFTKNKKAAYKYGHKDGCDGQLSIILNHIRNSAMFRDLVNLIPETMENGEEIVAQADVVRETFHTDLHVPLVQPLQFHALGAE